MWVNELALSAPKKHKFIFIFAGNKEHDKIKRKYQ